MLAISLAVAMTLAVQEAPPAAFDYVERGNWTYLSVSADGDTANYAQRARQGGMVWLRSEYLTTEEWGVRSYRILVEIDCPAWRYRALQDTFFLEPNMRGEARSGAETVWAYAAPNSLGERALEFGCNA